MGARSMKCFGLGIGSGKPVLVSAERSTSGIRVVMDLLLIEVSSPRFAFLSSRCRSHEAA